MATITHTVKEGENLNQIAKQYGYSDYGKAGITGYGSNPNLIKPGQVLSITGQPLKSNLVTTSNSSRYDYAVNSAKLNNALSAFNLGTPGQSGDNSNNNQNANTNNNAGKDLSIDTFSDPYTQMLDRVNQNGDNATKALIATIKAQRQNRGNEVNREYDRYKGGLQLLGIQHNQAEFTPDLLASHIQGAENERLTKLQELDRQEATTLLEAKSAADEKDFRTLKEKMDYIQQLKKDRINTLKDSYDSMKYTSGIAEETAKQIYTTMNTLGGADKENFLKALATQRNIPLGALVSAVSAYAVKNKKTGKGGTSSTSSSKPQIGEFTSGMTSVRGDDGYIDPGAWLAARDQWQKRGGSLSTFNSNFKRFLNPLSYDKAGFKASE